MSLRGSVLSSSLRSRSDTETTLVVLVYGTGSALSGGRFGFVTGEIDEGLEKELPGYKDDGIYLERRNGGGVVEMYG